MIIEVINDPAVFEAMAAEWNQLLSRSAIHVPFLRHEFLSSWWQARGGGEWDGGELLILAARNSDRELSGLAPFFFLREPDGAGVIRFLGTKEIADYLDFITAPTDQVRMFTELVQFLEGDEVPVWQRIELHNLLDDSPTISALEPLARARGWDVSLGEPEPAPCLTLPETWDEYLGGLPKKQRHEIRRKIRRADNDPRSVQWYVVEKATSLDEAGTAFLNMMADDPQKPAFLTSAMRTHLKNMMAAGFRAGWLQLAFLEVAGEKAAGYLNFDIDNRIWVYNSGWNMVYADLSPGWVLLSHVIQWAIAQKREAVDFLRGTEKYKYRFGGVDRRVVRLTVWR